MSRAHRLVVAALGIVGLLSPFAAAQEFRATISGRVTDPSKAAIPGATITVRNEQTNETSVTVSNARGHYTVLYLKPGRYTISVELQGFKKHVHARQPLEVGQTITLDVELQVGGAAEAITVVAEEILDSAKPDQGAVIDNRQVNELPMSGRNPFMLAMLAPGVGYNGEAIFQRPFDNGAIAEWGINGGQSRQNEFLLDGAPNNSIQGGNNIAYVPPVESVQEFKIVSSAYDAQYGRSAGAAINVSLKSGTNSLHGTIYEYYRRRWLDANSFFANALGEERPEHYLDQYGVQLDGPLMVPGLYNGSDKTFFLAQIEGYREGVPEPRVLDAPPEEFRRGDFSNYRDAQGRLITIYDPATGRDVNGVWVRDPFPGNVIPAHRINPIGQKLLSYYPLPDYQSPGSETWRNNYLDFPNHRKDKFYNVLLKVDHVFGPKDRSYVSYSHNNRLESRNANAIRGVASDSNDPLQRLNHRLVADWVHMFNSNTVLNVRASAAKYEQSITTEGNNFDASRELGMDPALAAQLPYALFPRVQVSDFLSLGRSNHTLEPTRTLTVHPTLSMAPGRHRLRMGLDMRLTNYADEGTGAGGMRIDFNRTFTQRDFGRGDGLSGSAVASLLLGMPAAGFVDNRTQPSYLFRYLAPWIQDDWKISSRLTLNLGFRWDLNAPVIERHDWMNYAFDREARNPASDRINKALYPQHAEVRGGVRFVGVDGTPDTPWKFDLDNFQPRVGFVFEIDKKTLLRGGAGRFFLNPTQTAPRAGYDFTTPIVASPDGNRTGYPNLLYNPFPNGVREAPGAALGPETNLGLAFSTVNPNFKVPYTHSFSLSVQRELPWRSVLEVSYVGSRTRDQQVNDVQINTESPELRELCNVARGGNRALCEAQIPNPYYQVPGFGGARFNNRTLSRYDLSRPFPAFGNIDEDARNDGRMWYDAFQFSLRKRTSSGVSFNVSYAYGKQLEEAGYVDNATLLENRSSYDKERRHIFAASSVWELPFGKGQRLFSGVRGLADKLVSGWQLSTIYRYASGYPSGLPDDVDYVKDAHFDRVKTTDTDVIRGFSPCVAQMVGGVPVLNGNSIAAGCTEPNWIMREPFTTRSTMFRDDKIRRPPAYQLDLSLAKLTELSKRLKVQLRIEAFNVTNTPTWERRTYDLDRDRSTFGTIVKSTGAQSNLPRHLQLGMRLLF